MNPFDDDFYGVKATTVPEKKIVAKKTSASAIASLVMGIVSICSVVATYIEPIAICFVFPIIAGCAIGGALSGVAALRNRTQSKTGKQMAIAGTIMALLTMLPAVLISFQKIMGLSLLGVLLP